MSFNQHGKGKGYLALVITSLVWGTTWVASKIGISEMPALQMAAIRQLIGGGMFVLFFLVVKRYALPTFKQFQWLFAMSILMFVMANGLSTWSLQYIPTGMSALIGALYPLSVVIIERIFFGRKKLTPLTMLGFVLGISGIAIVFYENAFHHHGKYFIFGIVLSAIAMLAWSVGTVFIARNKALLNPYYGIGWQMLISAVLLFLLSEFTQPVVPIASISLKTWLVILYLVVFGSIIAFIAFIYSMKKLLAPIASLYAYINPLVAMIAATFLLEEKLTMNIVWGSVVTVAGVFLVNYSIRKTNAKNISEGGV
jgi:drug/metabolite transporter (DMT)-like permease